MSNDPHAGIASVSMYNNVNGQLTGGEGFTAVEIAPDEFLTAAHAVTNPDGSLRNAGYLTVGYNGTKGSGVQLTIDGVHAFSNTHTSGTETDSTVGNDLALIHVSSPDTGGTVFSMTNGTTGGQMTVSGYPANGLGVLSESSENVTAGYSPGELLGQALLVNGNAQGSSGGPVWSNQNGTPTVGGIISANSGTTGLFAALTDADIAQVKAWVYSDDQGKSWASQYAPVSTPVPVPPPAPQPVDRLDQLVSLTGNDAASSGGLKASILNDVSNVLSMARQQGYSGSDLAGAAYTGVELIREGSETPQRSLGYLIGVIGSEMGSGGNVGALMNFASNVLGESLDTKAARQAAVNGYKEDQGYAAKTTAAHLPNMASMADLVSALGDGGAGGWSSEGHQPTTGASASALMGIGTHKDH